MAQVQVHAPRELATSPPLTSAALQTKNSPLLPFNVTPPKKTGPSEAERKIEALTRQIEEQMEKDAESEYFGEFPFSSEKLWRQIGICKCLEYATKILLAVLPVYYV